MNVYFTKLPSDARLLRAWQLSGYQLTFYTDDATLVQAGCVPAYVISKVFATKYESTLAMLVQAMADAKAMQGENRFFIGEPCLPSDLCKMPGSQTVFFYTHEAIKQHVKLFAKHLRIRAKYKANASKAGYSEVESQARYAVPGPGFANNRRAGGSKVSKKAWQAFG